MPPKKTETRKPIAKAAGAFAPQSMSPIFGGAAPERTENEDGEQPAWTPYPGPQTQAFFTQADELYYGGAAGGGKALAINTEIQTPAGWAVMGNLNVGDFVFGTGGKPTEVLAAHDVMYDHVCFEIEFDTGEVIVADAEHLWHTYTSKELSEKTSNGSVRTTAEIARALHTEDWYPLRNHSIDLGSENGKRRGWITITAIRPTKSVPVRCIRVAAENHLFLVGRGRIPTHNTQLIVGLALLSHRNTLILRREAVNTKGIAEVFRNYFDYGDWRGNGPYGGEFRTHDGRLIELAGCQLEADKVKYRGVPHDLICYDELPDFCLTSEHEVCTRRGWVKISEVTTDDEVVSLAADWTSDYRKVTATQTFNHDGDMVRMTSRSMAFFATPNHRLVITGQVNDRWRFSEVKDLPEYPRFPIKNLWVGKEPSPEEFKFEQPLGRGLGRNVNAAESVDPGDWCEFLGWFLSEGSAFIRGKNQGYGQPCVCISQTKPAPTLAALMGRLPWRSTPDENTGYRIFSRQLHDRLVTYGTNTYNRRIPRWLMEAPVWMLRRFFDAFVKGDGSVGRTGGIIIGLANKGLIDDLQEISSKLGLRSTGRHSLIRKKYDCWWLSIHNKERRFQAKPHNFTTEKYCGTVHCITVDETHTFLCRYQNKVFWSGNSETIYTFINGWNRPADPRRFPNQRCRVVGAGNPPMSAEGEWVRKRWAAWLEGRKQPGELGWYTKIGDDKEEREFPDGTPIEHKGIFHRPKSRTFIPARLEDNPELMAAGYADTLNAMPEPLRSMLRYGDMKAGIVDHAWQLIPTAWIAAAQKRGMDESRRPKTGITALGVDVARGGEDNTICAPLRGVWLDKLVARPGIQTKDGATVFGMIKGVLYDNLHNARINIDAIGVGASVYDVTQMLSPPLANAHAIVSSEGTEWQDRNKSFKFRNVRSAMWWNLYELLNPEAGSEDTRLCLPPDAELAADLAAPHWRLQAGGTIQVEPKESETGGGNWGIRQRLGRSPDKGDACALAVWEGETPNMFVYGRSKPTERQTLRADMHYIALNPLHPGIDPESESEQRRELRAMLAESPEAFVNRLNTLDERARPYRGKPRLGANWNRRRKQSWTEAEED